jgi:hypothetical protein
LELDDTYFNEKSFVKKDIIKLMNESNIRGKSNFDEDKITEP